jgi:hypothetical protein
MKSKSVNFGEQHKFLRLVNPNIITENRNVLWFNSGIFGNSQDNAMPEFLMDLVNSSSSIHSNLCNLKYTQMLGQNLDINDSTDVNAKQLTDFIAKRNKSGDNLKGVYAKCVKDFSIFEACPLQILFDRNGKVAEVYHVPTENVRMEVPNQYGQVENYYVSRFWADISNVRYKKRTPSNSAVKVHAFAPEMYKEYPVQMLYVSAYNPTTFYSIPMYTSAINWILIDNMVSNFHIKNLKTNYFIAGMLTQQGNPTAEEMEKFIQDFRDLYLSDNANNADDDEKMLFSWVDDIKNQKPEFTPFQSEKNDSLFQTLLDKAEAKIVYGHNAFPEIAGVNQASSTIGNDGGKSLYTALQAYTQLVIEPMKDVVISAFNRILEVNSLPNVRVVTPAIRVSQPVAVADGSDLTEEERRLLLYNLPPKDINNTVASTKVEATPNN